MSHRDREELSSRYRDGDLEMAEIERFEEHLAGCEACREAVSFDALIAGHLTASLDAACPEDLESRVLARVHDRPWPVRAARWLRHGEFRLPVPVAVAAALVLLVAGIFTRGAPDIVPPGTGDGEILTLSTGTGEGWVDTEAAGREVRSLLRRTRTLLLALSTAVPDEEGRYHLEAEESLSRDLIREVRMVEAGSFAGEETDILTLIRDLELILLDVSTWGGEADAERLALLQEGISERSLIYRVSTYDPRFDGN